MANRYENAFKRGDKWYYKGKSGKPIPIKTSASRYREMAKNPNQRPSVPTKYLPANLRRQREMNIRLDTPVGAGSSVTNRDVAREAGADANVRYGQAEQDLGYQIQRQQARQSMIPSYMDQYRQQLAQAQQRTQQAYAQAQQQMTGLGQALGQSAPGVQTANDPQAAVVAQQAAAVRQAGAGSLAGLAATQGANTNARYESDIANVGLRLVEELAREAGRGRELGEKRSQLLREKGEYTSSQRAKLTDTYRKGGLENLAFGADQAKAAVDAKLKEDKLRSDKFDRAQRRKATRTDDARADAAERRQAEKDKYQRENKLGPYKPPSDGKNGTDKDRFGNTRKDRQRAQDAYAAALNIARQLGGEDWKQTQNFLISKKKINPLYARAAAMQAVLGYVGRETAESLRKRGVQKGYKIPTRKTGSSVKQGGSKFGGFG